MASLGPLRTTPTIAFLALCLALGLWSSGAGWQQRAAQEMDAQALAFAAAIGADLCASLPHRHADCPFCRLLDDGGQAVRPGPRTSTVALVEHPADARTGTAPTRVRSCHGPRAPPLT